MRSAEPVQNHVLLGSNAIDLTHPKWPLITYKGQRRSHNSSCWKKKPLGNVVLNIAINNKGEINMMIEKKR